MLVLLLPFQVSSLTTSQVGMDINAELLPMIDIYYDNQNITGASVDLQLNIDSASLKFKNTSKTLFLVGNVVQADIIFEEHTFILNNNLDDSASMQLSGSFIFNGAVSDAAVTLRVPVIKELSKATVNDGFKVSFSSLNNATTYRAGDYSGQFTLVVVPVT